MFKMIGIFFTIVLLLIQLLNATESREGWYGGLGIGFSGTKPENGDRKLGYAVPLELGYGINEDFLIYFSGEATGRTNEYSYSITEGLGGLGISYYIDDNHYIKATNGTSLMTIEKNGLKSEFTGPAFSFGYGYAFSHKKAVEITYANLSFNKLTYLGQVYNVIDSSSKIITIVYKYRWF